MAPSFAYKKFIVLKAGGQCLRRLVWDFTHRRQRRPYSWYNICNAPRPTPTRRPTSGTRQKIVHSNCLWLKSGAHQPFSVTRPTQHLAVILTEALSGGLFYGLISQFLRSSRLSEICGCWAWKTEQTGCVPRPTEDEDAGCLWCLIECQTYMACVWLHRLFQALQSISYQPRHPHWRLARVPEVGGRRVANMRRASLRVTSEFGWIGDSIGGPGEWVPPAGKAWLYWELVSTGPGNVGAWVGCRWLKNTTVRNIIMFFRLLLNLLTNKCSSV